MNDNDDALLKLAARLNAHEFLLEVFIANWMATMTADQIAAFAADLIRVGRKSYGPLTGDPAEMKRVQLVRQEAEAAIERLARKAARRALEIRERTERDRTGPR